MNDSKRRTYSISSAELEILKILWSDSPLTADLIIQRLDADQSTHPKTVKTLLSRLVKKEAISFKEEGRRYHYFALLDREEYFKHQTNSFLDRYFDGQLSPLISHFSKQRKISDQELAELENLIQQIKDQDDE